MTDSKIALANSQTGYDIEKNTQDSIIQQGHNIITKDIGRGTQAFTQGVNTIVGTTSAGLFGGGQIPGGAATGATIGFTAGLMNTLANLFGGFEDNNKRVEAENARINAAYVNLNNSLTRKNQATVSSYRMEQNANVARFNSNAQSQLLLLQGEIADIKNIPNQTMNVSNITKMLTIGQGEISIINETINETQQKEMFKF